ncbi:MAG: FAD-binding oxidoreductase [Thermomicrobiales bacterium]
MPTNVIDDLQRHVQAQIITRSHPTYQQARRVWNKMIDRQPLMIVQPQTAQEVVVAIGFARENDLPLSVKGGGHGVAGLAVCDDGMVIDLSRMHAVSVDPLAETATVQGGARLRSLDTGSQAHGLATTAGIYRETGVAGLALGGGVGLLMRDFGLTCDNLLSAEVVTADGHIVEASNNDNTDLFWALRGGGGNFGVVTRMNFRLHPLTQVIGGRIDYKFEDAQTLSRVYQDVMSNAPNGLQAYFSFGIDPKGAKSASITLCDVRSHLEVEDILGQFRTPCQPVWEHVGKIPYLQMQQHWDDSFPNGMLRYWKSSFLATISDDIMDVCHDMISRQSLPNCHIDIEPMGGVIARIPPYATAFADRDAASTLLIATGWTDAAETDTRISWARETWQAIQPFTKPSAYVNYLDQGDENRTEAVYGPNYPRLVEVKRRYDPDNVFRFNANIRP